MRKLAQILCFSESPNFNEASLVFERVGAEFSWNFPISLIFFTTVTIDNQFPSKVWVLWILMTPLYIIGCANKDLG